MRIYQRKSVQKTILRFLKGARGMKPKEIYQKALKFAEQYKKNLPELKQYSIEEIKKLRGKRNGNG